MAKKLNQITGMPQMNAAFTGWMYPITLVYLTNSINDDGFNVPTETTITFEGTIQPLSAEQLELKPDAQRSFEWLQIHVKVGEQVLKTGDQIIYNDVKFRIKAKKDYSLNNYIEYHAMEATQDG